MISLRHAERQQARKASSAMRKQADVRLKTLMYDAFTDAPGHRLALRSLYKELERRHPELRQRKTDWKGTVRHLLCSLPDFNQDKKCKVRGVWMMKDTAKPCSATATATMMADNYANIVLYGGGGDVEQRQSSTEDSPVSVTHSAFDSPHFGSPSSAFFDSPSTGFPFMNVEWQASFVDNKDALAGLEQLQAISNTYYNYGNTFKNVDFLPYFNHTVFDQFRDTL